MKPVRADTDSRLKRFGRALWHWSPEATVFAVTPLLFAVMPFMTGHYFHVGRRALSWTLVPAAIAIAMLLPASFSIARRRRRADSLEAAVSVARTRADEAECSLLILLRTELEELSKTLDYFTNERLSLFRWEDNGFTLIARFSRNPVYDRSPGRISYPQQAVLWKAWQDHSAAVAFLPATPTDPSEAASAEWLDAQQQQGINRSDAERLVMRSRSYAAVRISPRKGPLGVVVAESINTLEEHAALKAAGSKATPRLDVESLDKAIKPRAARISLLLDRARTIDKASLVEHRKKIQQESFGVLQAPPT